MCSRRSPWNGSRIVLMNWREQAAIVARHTIKPICDRIDAVAPRTPGYVRGSVRPDARELHHLGPFLNVLGDELAELGGRTCKPRVAKVCNPRFHRGIGENSIDLLVEFLDDIGGRILWRADTQPRARIIARQKIVQ